MKDHAGLEKLNITVRIYSPLIDRYYGDRAIFRSKNYAAERAAEIYPHLREIVLDSLKGVFEKREIALLADIFRSDRDPKFLTSADTLRDKIKANTKFMKLKDEEKEMIPGILAKIEEFDSFKAIVFTEWLATFISFEGVYKQKVKVKFDEYVKRLL